MDPENAPRRTKPDQEPLTIDLHATPETPAAHRADEPSDVSDRGEHVPADDGAGAEAAAEAAADAERRTDLFEDSLKGDRPGTLGTEGEIGTEAEAGAGSTFASDRAKGEARAEPAAPAYAQDTAAAPSGAASNKAASTSGALAAGILGGLIALAGAGVLQYAGIVPALGPSTGQTASGRDFGAEIDALKRQPAASDTTALEQRLAAIEQAGGGAGDSKGVDALASQVASLTQEVEQLRSGLADQQRSAQTATSELSTRIEEAEKKLDEPASDVQLARAVAVTALKTAIDRGGPFLAELDALKSVSPDDPAIAGLSTFAARGVPSRSDLTRTFPATADAMLNAIRGADPNQGVFSRLVNSAASAVRIRPVGSVEGTGPEAVVARIEDRLANGDLKGARLEWDGLPQTAKDAGADFRARLDDRITAEGLIDTAVSGAVSGSASAKQG